jgi:hypothetical protein
MRIIQGVDCVLYCYQVCVLRTFFWVFIHTQEVYINLFWKRNLDVLVIYDMSILGGIGDCID